MQRTKPPFRADEVGSLLRPQRIKEARARLEKGEISAEELRKAEDMEIEKVVHRQASTGLKLATDGEFRRSWWHFDFLANLTGCELFHPEAVIKFPAVMHSRGGRRAISKEVYPDLDAFFEDLAKTYRKAVKAFYDAGCRYLQFDDTVWAYLCSQDELQKARQRGDNPDR